MIKPIVKLNKMAMNESIATTCCYAWNGMSLLGSAQILHGGRLDAEVFYKYFYPETNFTVEVKDAWLNVGVLPSYQFRDKVTDVVDLPYRSGGEWYVGREPLTQFGGLELVPEAKEAWVLANPVNYFKKVESHTDIKHVGATEPHNKWNANATWLADHLAVQYSS